MSLSEEMTVTFAVCIFFFFGNQGFLSFLYKIFYIHLVSPKQSCTYSLSTTFAAFSSSPVNVIRLPILSHPVDKA